MKRAEPMSLILIMIWILTENSHLGSGHSGQVWGGPQISSYDSFSGGLAPNTTALLDESGSPRIMYGLRSIDREMFKSWWDGKSEVKTETHYLEDEKRLERFPSRFCWRNGTRHSPAVAFSWYSIALSICIWKDSRAIEASVYGVFFLFSVARITTIVKLLFIGQSESRKMKSGLVLASDKTHDILWPLKLSMSKRLEEEV